MYTNENLTRLKKMDGLAPEVMKAFWAFDKAAVAEGAIPVKYKERCRRRGTRLMPYCIGISGSARKAGATDAELPRAGWSPLPCAGRPSPATTHALANQESVA
jgi:hypothetical protein